MKPLGFHLDQMRELLEARDVLHGIGSPPPERAAARRLLAEYAQLAGERVADLREQLAYAQEFSEQLDQEVAALT